MIHWHLQLLRDSRMKLMNWFNRLSALSLGWINLITTMAIVRYEPQTSTYFSYCQNFDLPQKDDSLFLPPLSHLSDSCEHQPLIGLNQHQQAVLCGKSGLQDISPWSWIPVEDRNTHMQHTQASTHKFQMYFFCCVHVSFQRQYLAGSWRYKWRAALPN